MSIWFIMSIIHFSKILGEFIQLAEKLLQNRQTVRDSFAEFLTRLHKE